MINSIAYFPFQCALNSVPVMSAILESARSNGIKTLENSMDADAVVIWSVLWAGRMQKNKEVYDHYKRSGRPVIVIDIGALYRGETWKVALDNLTAEGFYGHKENLDPDRPQKLGIGISLNLTRNPRIVIAAQNKRSLQVARLPSMEQWINQTIQQIQAVTDRPIVVRPHPRSALDTRLLPTGIEIEQPKPVGNTYDSFNLCFDCHAIVNYNSGPGIQAALAGTRPIVDQTSLAYPVGIAVADIDKPYDTDRDQWLIEICHTEYTLEELRKGAWLHRLCLL